MLIHIYLTSLEDYSYAVAVILHHLHSLLLSRCTGSRDPGPRATSPFQKKIQGPVRSIPWSICVPNLKSVSLAILELLAFNAQEFYGSHDPDHTQFSKKKISGSHAQEHKCPWGHACQIWSL